MSVGIPLIDRQHQRFFEILNSLEDALAGEEGSESIEEILKSLVEYMHFHFQTEEDHMKENFFQGFEGHRAEHEVFSNHVRDLMRRFRAGKKDLASETRHFLIDWLASHIMNCDQKYAQKKPSKTVSSKPAKPRR